MLRASEIEPVAPGIVIWRFYDPTVKADLFSTGLQTPSGLYLVDPIPLTPDALSELTSLGKVRAIVVTNENHSRAAAEFAETCNAPIRRHGSIADPAIAAISIQGGPPGEVAVYSDVGNGTMIIADALINFGPHGFALLPSKYCTDAKVMRRSLTQLLDYSFERMFFAHGLPILTGGRGRLEALLNEHR